MGTPFNIMEIQLFDSTGVQIPSAQLTAALSSEYSGFDHTYPASNCIDGDLGTTCGTFGIYDGHDASPWAVITYPCANGSTSLSKVKVYNSDVNADRLLAFMLMFLDATGASDRASYSFTTQEQEYTIEGEAGEA
jgi:hypothetical protein